MAPMVEAGSWEKQSSSCSASRRSSVSSVWSAEEPDPMDADTYRRVLEFMSRARGTCEETLDCDDSPKPSRSNNVLALLSHGGTRLHEDLLMLRDNVELEFSEAEVPLRQDLAANKARWYGVWTKDLWCFLRNNNPFLAMFFSHRLHPVSQCSRWAAFGMQFLFVLFISCAVTEGGSCLYCGVHACGEPSICGEATRSLEGGEAFASVAWMKTHTQDNFCCTCDAVRILWFLDAFGTKLGSTIYMVLLNCAFNVAVFQLLMCLCVQRSGPRVREGGELLGKVAILSMAAGMAYKTPGLVRFIHQNHAGWYLLGNFLSGKLFSMLFVTLVNVAFFSILWRRQRPVGPPPEDDEDCTPGGFHVTAEDYQAFCRSLAEP